MNDQDEPQPEEQVNGEPEEGPEDAAASDVDASMAEGVEHLQSAAREMIAAARTFLDVVEEVVGDNAAVASVAEALGSFGQVVSRAASRAANADGAEGPPEQGDEGAARSRVQHIDLS
jgi:hypothetical protein